MKYFTRENLQALSHVFQIAAVILAVVVYFHTVVPVFETQVLGEQVAKLKLEKGQVAKHIDQLREQELRLSKEATSSKEAAAEAKAKLAAQQDRIVNLNANYLVLEKRNSSLKDEVAVNEKRAMTAEGHIFMVALFTRVLSEANESANIIALGHFVRGWNGSVPEWPDPLAIANRDVPAVAALVLAPPSRIAVIAKAKKYLSGNAAKLTCQAPSGWSGQVASGPAITTAVYQCRDKVMKFLTGIQSSQWYE